MMRLSPRLADLSRPGALLLALGLSLALGACYTAMRHPATGEPVDVRSDESCYRCHASEDATDPDLYPWGQYYGQSASPWINYYASPWWYDSRWERNPPSSGGHEDAGASSLSDQRAWGRRARGGAVPDSLRQRGSGLPPAPIVSAPPPAPMPGGTPASGEANSGTKGSDDQKKKEEKEQKRRALRR